MFSVLLLALLPQVHGHTPSNSVLISMNTTNYRIQALSGMILRIEEETPELGFIDNNTNLIRNRSAFSQGIPLLKTENTSHYIITSPKYKVIIPKASNSGKVTSTKCSLTEYSGYDQTGGKRSKEFRNGTKTPSFAACCELCETDPTCEAIIFHHTGGNCYPMQFVGPLKPSNDNSVGIHGRLPPPPPKFNILITDAQTGKILFNGEGPGGITTEPTFPNPGDFMNGSLTSWTIRDGPRFIPPPWGITPAPAGFNGPLANTSGVDTRPAVAADVYIFLFDASQKTSETGLQAYETFRSNYYTLTGAVPLLPDWAFGFWFTWYHKYNQTEKMQEILKFESENIPLDVASLDMDWRNLTVDYEYVVNVTDFPNMSAFLSFAHSKGKKVFFNDHPEPLGSGMTPPQPQPQMSPQEVKFRYDGLTSILDLGLDFWWFDPNWKFSLPPITLGVDTLDYVGWGSHIFFDVMTRYYKEKRPNVTRTMMLGGWQSNHPSSHRNPVWWTGDNMFDHLQQAVEDEINGGIKMKPYTHPDCTGHHGADEIPSVQYPPEVYSRWVQFCSLGTIYRIHSSSKSKGRRPWTIGDDAEEIMRNMTDMRYKLLPYFTEHGALTSVNGTPLVRRLDLVYPQYPESTRTDQYLLGSDLFVAPVDPFDGVNQSLHNTGPYNKNKSFWLPPGTWINAFTGETHTSASGHPANMTDIPTNQMPLFHKAGGMVVTIANPSLSTEYLDWSHLVLHIFMDLDDVNNKSVVRKPNRNGHVVEIVCKMFKNTTARKQGISLTFSNTFESNSLWTIRVHSLGNVLNLQSTTSAFGRVLKPDKNTNTLFGGPGVPSNSKGGDVIELQHNADDPVEISWEF
eukprot:m.102787 g.102787  ORF g.102787 m.102787 type:complete len:852 (-) comp13786_c0_seq1:34-2589(-)